MRVLAGSAKGRKLVAPKGLSVRPTPAKVRGAIFDILADRIAGTAVLDLFCGSGALGIEALSRGAYSATFVDGSGKSLAATRRNLDETGFADVARTSRRKLPRQLDPSLGRDFALVFADPPYALDTFQALADALTEMTRPDAVWVFECSARAVPESEPTGWVLESRRTYGDTAVLFLIRRPEVSS